MGSPRDPKYRVALSGFTLTCQRLGLTQTEAVIVAAQFAGMAVATCQAALAHEAQLLIAAKAMRDAYENKIIGGAASEIFARQ
jgi:hypothetical protein